jgi:hypothetical protein
MREPDPYLTPARVGLIMIAAFVFVVIFARVVTLPERQEARAEIRQDTPQVISDPVTSEPITQGIGGIRGLRGSLP